MSQVLEVRRDCHDSHAAGVTAPVDTMPAREDSEAGAMTRRNSLRQYVNILGTINLVMYRDEIG